MARTFVCHLEVLIIYKLCNIVIAMFEGWWFGMSVGGTDVWGRDRQATQMPPKVGWTIPWDGEAKREFRVMSFDQHRFCEDKI